MVTVVKYHGASEKAYTSDVVMQIKPKDRLK